ncbi:ATP synthase F1 subunit delta [Kosmotoga pacifica]|uniref:ATP synthase subunit delta n=1 Tax=Kosmotoga pacifica TaxID=1330330 RepID=A0A0G2ZB17_9BACT|nr:ATP synthase F1 subunit delta [Kosmotoga pacifica]AKI96784.1 hypothetical protein IX53_01940 [Kosmotoga pacifica]
MKYSPTVAFRYARALFLCSGKKNGDEIVDALRTATELIGKPEVSEILLDPTLPRKKASEMLLKFLGEVPEIFSRFITVLGEKRRLEYLPYIFTSYVNLLAEARGEIDVEVETALELTGEEYKRLRKYILAKTGREPSFKVKVVPELIAGLILKYEDKVVDMSVLGRLKRIKQGASS